MPHLEKMKSTYPAPDLLFVVVLAQQCLIVVINDYRYSSVGSRSTVGAYVVRVEGAGSGGGGGVLLCCLP